MKFLLSTTAIASLLLVNVEARWQPKPGLTWNYVLGDDKFNVHTEKAQVIDVDYELSASKIQEFHNAGKKVICYFSGGTVENWRNDFSSFKAVSGLVKNVYDGWDDEYWLDYRVDGIKSLIKKRMQIAKNKNCDGIEVDNLDGYSVNKGHWDLKESDAIQYAKWLGNTAHSLDIAIGLKNIPGLLDTLGSYFDFAINESCVNHGSECSYYKKFISSGKAVFGITYGNINDKLPALCKSLNGVGISMIVKSSQNLRQAGWTFDGKSQCGSGFSTGGVSSSSSSNSSANQVKKTTTVAPKPTTVVPKRTTVASKPTIVSYNPSTTAAQKPVVSNTPVSSSVNTAAKNNAGSNIGSALNTSANTAINASNANASNANASNAANANTANIANAANAANVANNAASNVPINQEAIASAENVGVPVDANAAPAANNNPVVTPVVSSANKEVPAKKNDKTVSGAVNEEEGGGAGPIVTGVAITGSVIGAAAAFVFVKKNPKQYNQLKRSISRSASSVKRGASTVKRRLTTKKSKGTPLPVSSEPNINDNQYGSYRYQFTQNFDL